MVTGSHAVWRAVPRYRLDGACVVSTGASLGAARRDVISRLRKAGCVRLTSN